MISKTLFVKLINQNVIVMSCNCDKLPIFPYRVVQTLSERNTIPCDERVNGMIVTVVQAGTIADESGIPPPAFTQYMLQGGNICSNASWKKYSVDSGVLTTSVGHVTEEIVVDEPLENEYFNTKYPRALEGFRVTVLPLNTTFMKISNNRWVITNNILNDE